MDYDCTDKIRIKMIDLSVLSFRKNSVLTILCTLLLCFQIAKANEYVIFTEEFAPFGYTKDG